MDIDQFRARAEAVSLAMRSSAKMPEELQIEVSPEERVTALLYSAAGRKRAGVILLLGHGAGANQTSAFMVGFAEGLAARGVDIVTFNFLYAEKGRGGPDRKEKLEACYLAAINAAIKHKKTRKNRLIIGGKSLGGRIASQVAASGIEGLGGLVFLGYPLHPPGKPDQLRAEHLSLIRAPMLFVQGERDPFGTPEELRPILKRLSAPADIFVIEGGDHSFKVPKRAPLSQQEVYTAARDEIARWVRDL